MRSPNQGLWSTLAMFIPLLAVPFLAAIGIPQFTPNAASSESDVPEADDLPPIKLGVGESLHQGADDLFAPLDRSGAQDHARPASSTDEWEDPFEEWEQQQAGRDAGTGRRRSAANSAVERYGDAPGDQRARPRAGSAADVAGTSSWPVERAAEPAGVERSPNRLLAFGDARGFPNERREESSVPPPQPAEANPFAMPSRPAGSSGPDADAGRASQSPFSHRDSASPESPAAPGAALTWGSAVRRLNELGIHDFQLNPGHSAGQFHFVCTFTPPEAPRIVRRFEAEASDPLAAVEKVLQQVEHWRAGR